MASSLVEIPEFSDRDVGIAGVEINKVWPLGLGLFLGVVLNPIAWWWTILMPFLGYKATQIYVEWSKTKQRDYIKAKLFSLGVWGYSDVFTSRDQVFIGDAVIGMSRRGEHE